MKILPIILILISLTKGNAQNEINIIHSFIEKVVLKEESFNFSKTKKYIEYNKSISDNKYIYVFVKNNIKFIKKDLQKCNFKYQLLTDKELKKQNIDFRFKTNYKKVYHLVLDKKVITTFIIDNGKIISFFYNIVKKKNQIRTPVLLNKLVKP